MTQTYKRLQKTEVVGLQKLKWLIFVCLIFTIYLNGPNVSLLSWICTLDIYSLGTYNVQFQIKVFSRFCYVMLYNHEYIHRLNNRQTKDYITRRNKSKRKLYFERRQYYGTRSLFDYYVTLQEWRSLWQSCMEGELLYTTVFAAIIRRNSNKLSLSRVYHAVT